MDPLTLSLGLSAIGTGLGIFGSQESAQAQKRITQQQLIIEQQHQKAMELSARREKLQQVRIAQETAARAAATGVNQGTEQGSATGGAIGQISGQMNTNINGINQNLQIGRSIFQANSIIDQNKITQSDAASTSALGAGISSLGNSLFSANSAYRGVTGANTYTPPQSQSGYSGSFGISSTLSFG